MKYLIFVNDSTGITDFRMEFLTELLKSGSVVVSTPDNGTVSEIRALGAEVIDTAVDRRGINPISDFRLFREYWKVLKTENPDIVITYTIKPNIYAGLACKLRRIPYAANITGLGTAFQHSGLLRSFVTMLYRVSLNRAKVVFFENCENQDIFINSKIVKREQTCLLNGAGVNLDKFPYIPYPTDNEETRFLFIGRVMKEKGIDELFAAMRMLRKDRIHCSVDVLGGFDEDYSKQIEACENEGWLCYHGYQRDVRPFIANCHCFVLPSWHEGMANTNLECAASGRPVITSNIHGCLEAVEDGVTGFLCEKQNADSLYQKMKGFCTLSIEERKTMGLSGRKRMEAVFDKKKVVEETIRHLNM